MGVLEKIHSGEYTTKLRFIGDVAENLVTGEVYRQDQNRLILLFKEDALTEVGLSDFPPEIADQVWEYAWNAGNSNDLLEVMYHLMNTAEMMKAAYTAGYTETTKLVRTPGNDH